MESKRIAEIQSQTEFPFNISVMRALLQVRNECAQENEADNKRMKDALVFISERDPYATRTNWSEYSSEIKAKARSVIKGGVMGEHKSVIDMIAELHRKKVEEVEGKIERLKVLVKEAYEEGWHDGGDGSYLKYGWENSDVFKELKEIVE